HSTFLSPTVCGIKKRTEKRNTSFPKRLTEAHKKSSKLGKFHRNVHCRPQETLRKICEVGVCISSNIFRQESRDLDFGLY
ncbi:hypothetical protein CU098_006785, partial [Rhizopus stolonifer]